MDPTNAAAAEAWPIRIRSGNFNVAIKSTAPNLLPAKLVWLQVRTLLGSCCIAHTAEPLGLLNYLLLFLL